MRFKLQSLPVDQGKTRLHLGSHLVLLLPFPLPFSPPYRVFLKSSPSIIHRHPIPWLRPYFYESLPRWLFYDDMILKDIRHLSLVHIYKHRCIFLAYVRSLRDFKMLFYTSVKVTMATIYWVLTMCRLCAQYVTYMISLNPHHDDMR